MEVAVPAFIGRSRSRYTRAAGCLRRPLNFVVAGKFIVLAVRDLSLCSLLTLWASYLAVNVEKSAISGGLFVCNYCQKRERVRNEEFQIKSFRLISDGNTILDMMKLDSEGDQII